MAGDEENQQPLVITLVLFRYLVLHNSCICSVNNRICRDVIRMPLSEYPYDFLKNETIIFRVKWKRISGRIHY